MSYSRKVYARAASELERRRDKAERTQSMRRAEVYAKIPELISIDREIASAGAEVIRAIGMGENAQQFIEELAKKNLASQQRRKDILKENGYPEDYLDAEYTCKKCRDTGFIGGVMCGCYKALLRDTALAELNELSPSARSTFESFNINYYPDTVDPATGINPRSRMKEILDFCRDYAADLATDSPSTLADSMKGELEIRIGRENGFVQLDNSSVILARYTVGEDSAGSIGIIGPTRMDYRRLVPGLKYISQCISKTMEKALEE